MLKYIPGEPAPACPALWPGTLMIRPLANRGLLLQGEADINSLPALRDALGGLLADGPHDFHLDLAGLSFIDVSCTREIITVAERYPAARVIVHDPPPGLLRITRLMRP